MGIKWSNVKVLLDPLSNEIYLGKYDPLKMTTSDRSNGVSEQVKAILMKHMERLCNDNNWTACEFESDVGYLRFFKKEERSNE